MSLSKPRTFLIEVSVAFPKGESSQEWDYIGKVYGDLQEGKIDEDVFRVLRKSIMKVGKWAKDNPDVHDCLPNSGGRSGRYICQVCGEDTTEVFARRLNIIALGVRNADNV